MSYLDCPNSTGDAPTGFPPSPIVSWPCVMARPLSQGLSQGSFRKAKPKPMACRTRSRAVCDQCSER